MIGNPHRDYKKHRAVVDRVYDEFEKSITKPNMVTISDKTGVPETTLRAWYRRWKQDEDWRPYAPRSRAQHFRIFSDQEEEALTNYIVENYFRPGFLFQGADFRRLAVQAFLEKHRGSKVFPEFQCSPGFVQDFKQRRNLSTRRAHYKRRPVVNDDDVLAWQDRLRRLLNDTPHDRVVNADETAWRILPNGCTTWAIRGCDSVLVQVCDDEKQTITVMASITAAGTKLPMMMIAKGTTHRCEETQLGDIYPHFAYHTESGWMNADAFLTYLKFLRQQFIDDQKVYLVLDTYGSHRTQSAREMAEALNISLIFVPPGMTDRCQPLDLRVFGALKSIAKAAIYRKLADNPGCRIGMLDAVRILISSWEHLSLDAVNSAWAGYLLEQDD